jgi:hypothetical protein
MRSVKKRGAVPSAFAPDRNSEVGCVRASWLLDGDARRKAAIVAISSTNEPAAPSVRRHDGIALFVFWPRYKPSLCDLPEMFLLRTGSRLGDETYATADRRSSASPGWWQPGPPLVSAAAISRVSLSITSTSAPVRSIAGYR